jgi:hypothetical protein
MSMRPRSTSSSRASRGDWLANLTVKSSNLFSLGVLFIRVASSFKDFCFVGRGPSDQSAAVQ